MTAFQLAVPLNLPLDGVSDAQFDFAGAETLSLAPPHSMPLGTELNEPPTLALALIGVATVAIFRGLHKRIVRRPAPAATTAKPATRKNAKAGKTQPQRKKQQGRKPVKTRRRAA